MRMRGFVYLLISVFIILSACGSGGSESNEDAEYSKPTKNEENAEKEQTDNVDTEESEEEDSDSNMPNVSDTPEGGEPNVPDPPEGGEPNVPDTPEGGEPNVPDLPEGGEPNVPDLPEVDLPNVDIDGDEDEITLQVPDPLLFEFDESDLKSEAEDTLDEVATILKDNDGADVQINGHTDNISDDDYNLKLSEERATSVKEYLDEKGALSEVDVKTKGYGKTKPIASNDTEEGQQKNRRVEIVVDRSGE